MRKKSADPPWSICLSNKDGSLDEAHELFGGSADRFDEVPISRTIDILEFFARRRVLPPCWAVRRWADHMGRAEIIHYIRAVAVENCSGTRYRKNELRDLANEKYHRAANLLRQTPVRLFCGLDEAARGWQSVKRSHLACRDSVGRRPIGARTVGGLQGPYQYLGIKAYLKAYLPLLVEALDQKDAPVHRFFW